MRRRNVGLLAAAGALAASVALSTPASAEVNHRTCPKGAFCVYSGDWETGKLLLATQGNWSGSIYNVLSIFNNGYPSPGAGQYEHHWNYITVKSLRWRGEC